MNPKLLTTRWERLPESVVLELQAEKLRHYLRTVVLPFSPHYREMFAKHGLKADSIRSLEDLEQIPFSSKADLVIQGGPVWTGDGSAGGRRPRAGDYVSQRDGRQ